MAAEQWFANLSFYAVALVTLASALGVVLARQVIHAACLLLPTLAGIAALFALLGGHLLMAIQILVYVGAINVLIIFAVLLLHRQVDRQRRILAGTQHLFAGVTGAGAVTLALVVGALFSNLPQLVGGEQGRFGDDVVAGIGEMFLTKYLLAFELTGILLLVTMIGAIVLARKERDQ